ncbi:uncharacterized protein HaLaN_16441, partial [Haematococcus lacustris]
VRVVSTCLVESDSPAAGSGPPRVSAPRKPPLLLLELQVSKDGSRLHYSAPLAAIITKATAVFDHAVTKVSGIPVLEPAIMEGLFWASVPQLASVHPQEEGVVRLRDAMTSALRDAVQPVADYLALYSKYEELLKMSPEAYIATLEAKGEELTLAGGA